MIVLHKGRISRTFRASAHMIAKTHSPEAPSSIRSQGLGLEHGRITQRSPSLQKEMSRVLQPLSTLLPSPVPALQSSWHDVTLQNSSIPQSNPARIPYNSQGNPLSTPLPPPLAHRTYAAAPTTGVVAASNPAYPDQSRQSSPPTICVGVSIDERRYQSSTPCEHEYLQ